MIAQPALVPAKAFGQSVDRLVAGDIGLVGGRFALGHDAAADMGRDRGAVEVGIARECDRRFDGIAKIFAEYPVQAGTHMFAQCIADIDLLAFDDQIHLRESRVPGGAGARQRITRRREGGRP